MKINRKKLKVKFIIINFIQYNNDNTLIKKQRIIHSRVMYASNSERCRNCGFRMQVGSEINHMERKSY